MGRIRDRVAVLVAMPVEMRRRSGVGTGKHMRGRNALDNRMGRRVVRRVGADVEKWMQAWTLKGLNN